MIDNSCLFDLINTQGRSLMFSANRIGGISCSINKQITSVDRWQNTCMETIQSTFRPLLEEFNNKGFFVFFLNHDGNTFTLESQTFCIGDLNPVNQMAYKLSGYLSANKADRVQFTEILCLHLAYAINRQNKWFNLPIVTLVNNDLLVYNVVHWKDLK